MFRIWRIKLWEYGWMKLGITGVRTRLTSRRQNVALSRTADGNLMVKFDNFACGELRTGAGSWFFLRRNEVGCGVYR